MSHILFWNRVNSQMVSIYFFFIAQFLFSSTLVHGKRFIGVCVWRRLQSSYDDWPAAADELKCNWSLWKFQIRLYYTLFTNFQHCDRNFDRTIHRWCFNLSTTNLFQLLISVFLSAHFPKLTSITLNSFALAVCPSINCLMAKRCPGSHCDGCQVDESDALSSVVAMIENKFYIFHFDAMHTFIHLPKKYSSALTALVVILNTVEWSKYCTERGNARVIQQNCIHRKGLAFVNLTVVAYTMNEHPLNRMYLWWWANTSSSTALMLCSIEQHLISNSNESKIHTKIINTPRLLCIFDVIFWHHMKWWIINDFVHENLYI